MKPHVVNVIVTNVNGYVESVESFISMDDQNIESVSTRAEEHFLSCIDDQELLFDECYSALDYGNYERNDGKNVWLSHSLNSEIIS